MVTIANIFVNFLYLFFHLFTEYSPILNLYFFCFWLTCIKYQCYISLVRFHWLDRAFFDNMYKCICRFYMSMSYGFRPILNPFSTSNISCSIANFSFILKTFIIKRVSLKEFWKISDWSLHLNLGENHIYAYKIRMVDNFHKSYVKTTENFFWKIM